jgi:hypothetical protein
MNQLQIIHKKVKTTNQKLVEKDRRFGRGIVISISRRVLKKSSMVYHVESETTNNKFYSVVFKEGPTSCNCPSFEHNNKDKNGFMCKHMWSVCHGLEYKTIIDETNKKETLTIIAKSYTEDDYSF